ncbi:uncharacterized protein LOC107273531 [Cephus cinctus]|uniref:Regulatory protein zeste n=1 Tax=Cephus cinctus TaxID=211228 RepID=A0AAJ7FTD2_CEPCN|nr:uncharacterized protein LOC107273531 [Cephus cinctus]XP_024946700.1 uncharacterized protein LOC107273531 [Cephus cinctus]
MSTSNPMENEKKRLRNQFSKEERSQLLMIMKEYSLLLDDKNLSILSRKEIWEAIETRFNKGGHFARTSAQLKKYWQNYKYHNKRTRIIQRDNPKSLSPITKRVIQIMAEVDPEEWGQYGIVAGLTPSKSLNASVESQTVRLKSKITKTNNQDISSNVILSSSEIFENSVTVSLICPENSGNLKNTSGTVIPGQPIISTPKNNENSENLTKFEKTQKSSSRSPGREKMKKIENLEIKCNSSCQVATVECANDFSKDFEKKKKAQELREFLEKFSSLEASARRRVLQEVNEIVESMEVPEADSETGSKDRNWEKIKNFNPIKEAARNSPREDIMAMQLILKDLRSMESQKKDGNTEEIDRCIFKCHKENSNEVSINSLTDAEVKETGGCKDIKAESVEWQRKFNAEIDNTNQSVSSEAFGQDNDGKDIAEAGRQNLVSRNSIKLLGDTKQHDAKYELDHRLELQKLETEESRLKLKVSELAIREIRLRIQSLEEERKRERELHALRLAEVSRRTYLECHQFTGTH